MQQKMSIFKGGNSVCRGPKIFQGCEMFKLNFDDFLMKDRGRCDRKCQFSMKETAFAGTQKFPVEF